MADVQRQRGATRKTHGRKSRCSRPELGCLPAGDRLVERLLTLRETCRLQGRRMHEYLTAAITADLHAQPIPALLTST
jgi:hypothetical protein